MMLDGSFAPVTVTADAFQSPPGSGSVTGSFLVAEHTASAYLVNSISLPELSRLIGNPVYYDFASRAVKGVSPVDGGYYLRPGFSNQSVFVGTETTPTSVGLRFAGAPAAARFHRPRC